MRVRFDAEGSGRRTTVPGEFTTEGATWLWQLVAGRLRNDQGGLSDHIGKGRVIAGDGTSVNLSASRLSGERTTWAETELAIDGAQIRFRAQVTADFPVHELGLTSVQAVLVARSVAVLELPPGAVTVDLVMELAPSWAPPSRNERLLALL